MQAYSCACGQPIFFDNTRCVGCGADIGFDPYVARLGPIDSASDGTWTFRGAGTNVERFRLCAHRATEVACNWMVPAHEPFADCLSCRTTRMIPILSRPRNPQRLRELEGAKRRVLFNILGMGLPVVPQEEDPERGVAFDFLETLEGEPPVMTGHAAGVITLNVAEADDDYRERNRDSLSEPYRTLVGHLRHELGHYYWDRLLRDGPWLRPFRGLFGDERADYGAALQNHYANGPPPDWRQRFISSYAASHPWEDWAESWAHYLHLRSTLETVASYRLDTNSVPLKITPFGPETLYGHAPREAGEAFLAWINAWVVLTTVLNETARSMGQPDIYPFVLNAPAVAKLHFVHRVVTRDDVDAMEPPPGTLQVPAP
ncbi:hypothetical protein DSM104443_04136 [Usitatibacter rugosus]|uniref:Zinc-ribbon domain-containing protein n=1 Tax=Usitatibacter rugosus TaxID=2732067 RepID=A0A6M4H121_9PROT|nr:putative zinc-binding metallopeptidase [Usitatibacter rugosus]QJR13042.1 hypothetical protein DSM104443_04136 [Usitatibacter rugosus]